MTFLFRVMEMISLPFTASPNGLESGRRLALDRPTLKSTPTEPERTRHPMTHPPTGRAMNSNHGLVATQSNVYETT
jgi:hypothetical protein